MINQWLSQGFAFHQAGRLDAAEPLYQRILAADPQHADALMLLGTLYVQRGRWEAAVPPLQGSLQRNPRQPNVWLNLGTALEGLGRFDESLAACDQALALDPAFAPAHLNRGNALRGLGRLEAALADYDRCVAALPDYADAHHNRGVALWGLQRAEAALESFERALALAPDSAETWLHRGHALHQLRRRDEALQAYAQALTLQPDYPDALLSRGKAWHDGANFAAARADFERAIALNPQDAGAQWCRSLLNIQQGHFEEGWRGYEWRWRLPEFRDFQREARQPLWLGQASLAGKTIVLHGEQGLGDTLQFCRYVPWVEQRGARVILEVQPPLVTLVQTLSPTVQVVARQGRQVPEGDFHTPLMSLPLAHGTTVGSIPANVPYLHADPVRRARWQAQLGPKTVPRIGLVWSGSLTHKADAERSLPAEVLDVLRCDGFEFHCLQKEVRAADRARLSSVRFHDAALHDFADTAALVAEMDLVITVDTAVAHLAGALNRPVWVMSRFGGCWRWLAGREDSPWYPSMRLFFQPRPGDWRSVVEAVSAQLKAHFPAVR